MVLGAGGVPEHTHGRDANATRAMGASGWPAPHACPAAPTALAPCPRKPLPVLGGEDVLPGAVSSSPGSPATPLLAQGRPLHEPGPRDGDATGASGWGGKAADAAPAAPREPLPLVAIRKAAASATGKLRWGPLAGADPNAIRHFAIFFRAGKNSRPFGSRHGWREWAPHTPSPVAERAWR
jgi:hypothetical protein